MVVALAAALGWPQEHAMGAFRWVRDHYQVVSTVSGALLVALGLLLFFNRSWWLNSVLDELLTKIGLGSI